RADERLALTILDVPGLLSDEDDFGIARPAAEDRLGAEAPELAGAAALRRRLDRVKRTGVLRLWISPCRFLAHQDAFHKSDVSSLPKPRRIVSCTNALHSGEAHG